MLVVLTKSQLPQSNAGEGAEEYRATIASLKWKLQSISAVRAADQLKSVSKDHLEQLIREHAEQADQEKRLRTEVSRELEKALATVAELQHFQARSVTLQQKLDTAQVQLAEAAKKEHLWRSQEQQYLEDRAGLNSDLEHAEESLKTQRRRVKALEEELDDLNSQVGARHHPHWSCSQD